MLLACPSIANRKRFDARADRVRERHTTKESFMFRRRQRMNEGDRGVVNDGDRTESSVETRSARHWSLAQIVSLIVGVAAIVFGIAALAKTGIHGDWLRSPHREVWSFHTTPLLAVIEIAFGVVLVLA